MYCELTDIQCEPVTAAFRDTNPGRGHVAPREHFIPTLDGWRALAIAAVIICHIAVLFNDNGWLVHLGAQGVALFFAISGYLITTRLLIDYERTGAISLPSFYVRRAFRILPAALVYLLTILILGLFGIIRIRGLDLLSAALFFSNYRLESSWFTAHFWSLSMEEHFYLLWPTAIWLIGPARIKWFAGTAILATIVWRHIVVAVLLNGNAMQRTDVRMDAFLFACLLAIIMRHPNTGPKIVRALSLTSLRAGVVVVLVITYFAATRFPGLRLLKECVQSSLIPLLIAGTVVRSSDRLGKCLDWAPLVFIGRISYSLYLWQELFLTNVIPGPLPCKLGLLLLVSTISYYGLEKRCIQYGRKLSKQLTADRSRREKVEIGRRTLYAVAGRT